MCVERRPKPATRRRLTGNNDSPQSDVEVVRQVTPYGACRVTVTNVTPVYAIEAPRATPAICGPGTATVAPFAVTVLFLFRPLLRRRA